MKANTERGGVYSGIWVKPDGTKIMLGGETMILHENDGVEVMEPAVIVVRDEKGAVMPLGMFISWGCRPERLYAGDVIIEENHGCWPRMWKVMPRYHFDEPLTMKEMDSDTMSVKEGPNAAVLNIGASLNERGEVILIEGQSVLQGSVFRYARQIDLAAVQYEAKLMRVHRTLTQIGDELTVGWKNYTAYKEQTLSEVRRYVEDLLETVKTLKTDDGKAEK